MLGQSQSSLTQYHTRGAHPASRDAQESFGVTIITKSPLQDPRNLLGHNEYTFKVVKIDFRGLAPDLKSVTLLKPGPSRSPLL